MRLILTLLVLLIPLTAMADDIRFAAGTKLDATVRLMADADGVLQLDRSAPIVIGGAMPSSPVTPGPVIPDKDLAEIVRAAVDAIPAYADKDKHAKSIAFTANFIAPYITGRGDAKQVTATIKTMSDAAVGEDADKWVAFWAAVDNQTASMTMPQYKTALGVIANALTSDYAASGESFAGQDTFGLPEGWLIKLLELIFKYLPMILELFS